MEGVAVARGVVLGPLCVAVGARMDVAAAWVDWPEASKPDAADELDEVWVAVPEVTADVVWRRWWKARLAKSWALTAVRRDKRAAVEVANFMLAGGRRGVCGG